MKDIIIKRVLFLCTGNSARSQIAEGFLRSLAGDQYEVFSAGLKPQGVSFLAVKHMAEEESIDISKQLSKNVDEFKDMPFDCVITLCDKAKESCPVFTGKYKNLHWSIKDPVIKGTAKEKHDAFHKAVYHIKQKIVQFLKEENIGA
jgi:arsenate reductase